MKPNLLKSVLITISIIFVFFLFASCEEYSRDYRVENGILDLRNADLAGGELIDIRGDMAFFWHEFITDGNTGSFSVSAAESFMKVPSYWEPHEKGYGIYSMRILLPESLPARLALKMTNVLENYSLYADGKLIYQVGQPGTSMEASVPDSAPALIEIPVNADEMNLVFQVSVWNEVYGGLARNIYFGDCRILEQARERGLFLDSAILGAILLVGLYHLMFCLMLDFERKNLSYLFLGFVFILTILFIGSKDELIFRTLFNGFGAAVRSKFIYSTLTLSVPFFFCYIYFVFPEFLSKAALRIVLAVSTVTWLIILFGKTSFFTRLLIPLEVFNLSVSVYVVLKLVYYSIRKRRLIIPAYLGGYLMLVTGVVFSMLDNFMVVPPWSPAVIFMAFSVYQTVLQVSGSCTAYRQVMNLNTAFIEMEKETEKQKDLSYIDHLTSLPNRRYLNEYMQKLWQRNSMTGTVIGMIAVDIDYFKLYNDRYGHLEGDACLKRVAAALTESLNIQGNFIARNGGAEFIAVLPGCSDTELFKTAEHMREHVETLQIEHVDSECSVNVTISAGTSSAVPEKYTNWLSLFAQADDALYSAKRNGRNRVESA